jgi:branched-chain amino acid transport system substrate-binding protein
MPYSTTARAEELESVKIGALLSLTGNWAQLSRNIQQGMELAVEQINQEGGVLNRKIELVIEDTDEEKSGGKVVTAYKLLRGSGISLFVGPLGAPGSLALMPIAKAEQVILIAPSTPGAFYKESPNFFNTGGDNYYTTKALAERVYAEGHRRVAIFGSRQPWEATQADTFRNIFAALGGEIVAEVSPEPDQTILNAEALRIVAAKPDAIVFAIYNQVAPAAKAIKQLGYQGAKYSVQLDSTRLVGSAGGLEGAQVMLFAPPSEKFIETFSKRYNAQPQIFADAGYDAVIALAEAIRRSGSLEVQQIAASLSSLQFDGSASEQLSFNREGLINRKLSIAVVKTGRIIEPRSAIAGAMGQR